MQSIHIDSVSKRFGGVLAVDDVSLTLKAGEIHGLIGPNGSGKTTLLNLLSGYYDIDAGAIRLDDQLLNNTTVQARAGLGIARTFQKPKLLESLSVLDNAMLGGWRDTTSGFMKTALAMGNTRAQEQALRQRAEEILHGVGLGRITHEQAGRLDHAEQRFLEIARSLCMHPKYILLDEPAGGLTEHEIEQLANIVVTMRDAGLGVLIVEHHTDFVFRISDQVTTLNLGKRIAWGAPDAVRNDPEVIRVYLGA